MQIDDDLRQAFEDMPREALIAIIKLGSNHIGEAPRLYHWFLSSAFSVLSGEADHLRLAPVTWPMDELEKGLKACGVGGQVCREPGRERLREIFQAVLDELLEELTERKRLS